jgi:hypothetical protein
MHGTSIEAARHGKEILQRMALRAMACETSGDWWALLIAMQDEQEREIDRSFDALLAEMDRVLSAQVTAGSRRAY